VQHKLNILSLLAVAAVVDTSVAAVVEEESEQRLVLQ
jgi:hypothetical protein